MGTNAVGDEYREIEGVGRGWSQMLPADSAEDACGGPLDQLRELARRLTSLDARAAESVHGALGSVVAPLEVVVAGRSGVGRSTLTRALEADERMSATIGGARPVFTQSRPFDVPGTEDPDLRGRIVLYVVVDAVRDADRRAIADASDRVIVAVNKADLFGQRWDAARGRAAEIADEVGARACAVTAQTGQGIDELSAAVAALAERQWWGRVERIGPSLARAAVDAGAGAARDAIEEYLGSDDAVLLAAAAALMRSDVRAALEAAPSSPRTADEAVECARWWEELPSETLAPQVCSLIVRGFVRRWALLGGDRSAPAVPGE